MRTRGLVVAMFVGVVLASGPLAAGPAATPVDYAKLQAEALAAIKTPVAERAIVVLCHDPDQDLAQMARKALESYSDPDAMKVETATF